MPESSENVPATRRLVRAVSWRAHRLARNWVWSQAHVIRRVRPASAATASPKRVLHVTTSFDLGGTQKQIEHLARFPQTRFEHRVVEIFPS